MPEHANDVDRFHARLQRASDAKAGAGEVARRCYSVHYRLPVSHLVRILPPGLVVDEVGRSGFGLVSVLVSTARAFRLGPVKLPGLHASEMVFRAAVRFPDEDDDGERRASWILLADSAVRGLGRWGSSSRFELEDDDEVWSLRCSAKDPLAGGWFTARTAAIEKDVPKGSVFSSVRQAAEFTTAAEGTCDYDAEQGLLSFHPIDRTDRDVSFCHDFDCAFPLIEHLVDELSLAVELDTAVLVQDMSPIRRKILVPRYAAAPDSVQFPSGAEAG